MLHCILTVVFLFVALVAQAAEYQWSVAVTSVTSDETKGPPRAYLWIPPACERVRAVVLGQHNMLEEPVLEHPAFRDALAKLGVAAVWITPHLGGLSRFGEDEKRHFDELFRLLADASGYAELANAPVVPIGHSAMADFPYLYAAANPGRTLAAISLKGSWPDMQRKPLAGLGEKLAGVPVLLVSGEYEWADERAGKSLAFRRAFPAVPFSMLSDAGAGHFDSHDVLVAFLALYLRKAAHFRLPAVPGPIGEPVALRPVDPARQGWRMDRWRMDKPPRVPAAPVGPLAGDRNEAFWCFDEEQARATERIQAAYMGKKPQLLGYEQAGAVVPQNPKTHQQVTLDFLPDPAGNGLTFKLHGVFLDKVPEGRPERWTSHPAGSSIDHATGGGPVVIRRICGPVAKISGDTFALRFGRLGFDNSKRSNEIWLLAEHPGDSTFKRAVQQAVLRVPLRNTEGAPQSITFPAIADRQVEAKPIKLNATSSAGVPVRYYVRDGPAEVSDDGTLTFLPVPTRAKYPVKVTVVAWQWGRSVEPKLQSAEPVERTFHVTRE